MKDPRKNIVAVEVILVIFGLGTLGLLLSASQWEPHSQKLVQEVARVPAQSHYWPRIDAPSLVQGAAADVEVSGKVAGSGGRGFLFLALSNMEYENWKGGRPYYSLVEGPQKVDHEFSFRTFPADLGGLKLVSVNPNQLGLSVEYDVKVSWYERTFAIPFNDPALRAALMVVAFAFLIAGAVSTVRRRSLRRWR